MFTIIDGAHAILYKSGVFYQRKVYRQAITNEMFVSHGSGYLRMYANGVTSVPAITWKDLSGTTVTIGKYDRLVWRVAG